jgi:AraC-like DNA-binding protein
MELPQIVSAGIFDSRVARKNAVVSKGRKTTMFEIELAMEEGGVSYIDSGVTPIRRGTVVSAKPDQMRHSKFPYQCYFVHMSVPKGALYDTLMNTPDFFQTEQYDIYEAIFKKLIKAYNSLSPKEEILLQSLVLELIYTTAKDTAAEFSGSKTAGNGFMIEGALAYIKEHLTEPLTLERVAGAMSLSPIYFHNTFKFAVGMTLRDYVEEQRLRRAIALLQTTDFSLAKIAYECGFSSQSYFSCVFKRRMKMTPRAYVQELYTKYQL